MTAVDPELERTLVDFGLLARGESPGFARLAGGVSSDIWLARTAGGDVCVKRALARLRVEAEWFAPIERNAYEVAWMEVANSVLPGCAPRVLGHDARRGVFAMSYLDPARFPVWKEQLRVGIADPAFAGTVGASLARLHAATADDGALAQRFASDRIFHDIRLEPYLLATARAHPDRGDALRALVRTTATEKRALVHGDVSPKNILVAPTGTPVFLDAECAWYGDPAFDVAFCLNHLLLKCLWTPRARDGFVACFRRLAQQYLAGVDWEPAQQVERRIAALLPGLLLGRVDGRSPVEYISEDLDRGRVRTVARRLLAAPCSRLGGIVQAWTRQLDHRADAT